MSSPAHPLQIRVPDPNMFVPRDYAMPFWEQTDQGKRFALLNWHRRAGKDVHAFNKMAQRIAESWHAPGDYVYFAGESAKQAEKIASSKTNEGIEYLDFFPKELVLKRDTRAGTITFKNNSVFHILSTLSPDAARGMNIKGVIFSEADYIPGIGELWSKVVFPMLNANGGFAYFVSTPRGAGFIYRLYLNNQDDPDWFCEIRTIYDTIHNGERVFSDRQLELARKNQTEAEIQQEYLCDFFAESGGTFYEEQFKKIREEGRICEVLYDPALPVHTFWDLGVRDSTVIWFSQIDWAGKWRIIDFYENTGKGIEYYIKECNKRPYTYGTHFGPHDIKQREMGTGVSVQQIALRFGFRFVVAPDIGRLEGINAARTLLNVCYFDKDKTFPGMEALRHYRKKESTHPDHFGYKTFTSEPVHDWASHAADAFRIMGVCRQLAEQNNHASSFGVAEIADYAKFDYNIHNGLGGVDFS